MLVAGITAGCGSKKAKAPEVFHPTTEIVTTSVAPTTEKATEKPTQKPTEKATEKPTQASKLGTLDDIAKVCSTQAKCETMLSVCYVDTINGHNPYDVTYDYGEAYNKYVKECDWSLVFDAGYYKATFPMLAVQYHYDDALLLEHFQTVGIHEGRQGSEKFNVGAYFYNCDKKVYDAFEKNWAAYYIYYMMNYKTEQKINTKTAEGHAIHQQYKMVLTKDQADEFAGINSYRKEAAADAVRFDSEVAAFANFRAYLNAHDGYVAHDWAENDKDRLYSYLDKLVKNGNDWGSFAENTVTVHSTKPSFRKWSENYRNSEKHYKAMVNTKYKFTGCSHMYVGEKCSQFDVYLANLNTPVHE